MDVSRMIERERLHYTPGTPGVSAPPTVMQLPSFAHCPPWRRQKSPSNTRPFALGVQREFAPRRDVPRTVQNDHAQFPRFCPAFEVGAEFHFFRRKQFKTESANFAKRF